MNMPIETVLVGFHDYTIIQKDGVIDKSDNTVCHGLTHDDTKTIELDSNLKPESMSVVLLHELFHALYSEYGLDDESGEEKVVNTLSSALHKLFLDNPDVLKYMNEQVDIQREKQLGKLTKTSAKKQKMGF